MNFDQVVKDEGDVAQALVSVKKPEIRESSRETNDGLKQQIATDCHSEREH
jgi:hypothetical protein